jgi:2-keto-4-pentenoate hydratase/2-oxohepta-3-ene-1,7-dioic acid hydratase in catechol pathway
MKFIRYLNREKEACYGWMNGEKAGMIDGNPFGEYRRLEASLPVGSIQFLSPVTPSKIICLGRNYADHATEQGVEIPDTPMLFLKPPSAVIANGAMIIIPRQSERVEHEAELAVVIGKTARWVPAEKTSDYIFGYTVANDVTARDLQHRDGQWTRGKGFDTFCPIGPWIETELDPSDTLITCRVNNQLRQMASTREMVFTVPQIIAYISTIMTLLPGDVILTGTPAGPGLLLSGDEVEIEIEGIGILRNNVA